MALPYVAVRIRLFGKREGGRGAPVRSGYRPGAFFGERKDGHAVLHDFELRLVDSDRLEPGEIARARVVPFAPDLWPARAVGDRIPIYEGPRHVGDAYVESTHFES